MSSAFVDTDVIIRLLTGDDSRKQQDAARLFSLAESGQVVLSAPVTVIADAVFVLSSSRLYNFGRAQVGGLLAQLVRNPSFEVQQKQEVLLALQI